MPNFKDPALLRQMRDISIRRYQSTGNRQHLMKANECEWQLKQLRNQEAPQPKKRGRPRKDAAVSA